MLSIVKAMRAKSDQGEPVAGMFTALARIGAHVRTGQVTLIAAAPGGGKTAFVAALVARMSPTRVLYLSPDTDWRTLGVRMAAMLTNTDTATVEQELASEVLGGRYWTALKDRLSHVNFDFTAAPSTDRIDAMLKCYRFMKGAWPQVLVVDNLKDVYPDDMSDDGNTHFRYNRSIDYFHELSRSTGMSVVILHHLTGTFDDGSRPPPLSSLLGKVARTPRLVLTLHSEINRLHVHVVKSSSSQADPTASGGATAQLEWHKATQVVQDPLWP